MQPQTIEITNFSGRLTRIVNGDLNSGFAKFTTSFGYDPFSKPLNLTWFDKPVNLKSSITGGSAITDLPLAAKIRSEANTLNVYMIGNTGNLYKLRPDTLFDTPFSDSIVGIASVKNGTDYSTGASMEFAALGSNEKIYIGHNLGVNSISFNGAAESSVGSAGYYLSGVFRPLKQFTGKVLFGNGPTFGTIDSTGTVTSPVASVVTAVSTTSSVVSIYSQLNPPLSTESVIQDIDVSPAVDYALLTTSNITPDGIASPSSRQASQASDSGIFRWNGVDTGITAGTVVSAYAATALQTYLQTNIFFSNDSFGSSISDGVKKILTLPKNKAPLPNATGSTGDFLYWTSPEVTPSGTQVASLYYFGSLDQENPAGLYRLVRISSSLANGFVYQIPLTLLVDNKTDTLNNSNSSIATIGYGKHYISTAEVNSAGSVLGLYGFTNNQSGSIAPQLGVYETQTQLFSKRTSISQIRVYTEPTVAGNGFQLDLVGSDGAVYSNGTFTYTFVAGSDETKMQGALERINFNPSIKTIYALGIRITNTGTTNMTIKKIEVDWLPEGK